MGTELLQGSEILVWHAMAELGENSSLRNIADHTGLPIKVAEKCVLNLAQLGLLDCPTPMRRRIN